MLHAINELSFGSVLIVLGKGVESYQEINGERIPYNEKEIILEAMCES